MVRFPLLELDDIPEEYRYLFTDEYLDDHQWSALTRRLDEQFTPRGPRV